MNSGPKLRLGATARLGIVVLLVTGCASQADTSTSSSQPAIATTLDTATSPTPPETMPDVPADQLGVVITQNREDPARHQFQLEFVNHTDRRYDITNVEFVWEGLPSPSTPKQSTIVRGQVLDLPVPFGDANCRGDGTATTMPDVASATVVTTLADGEAITVPVYDKWDVIRNLYLADCERQWIESQVAIEWTNLHRAELGRPVTVGSLRLTRRNSTATISVTTISGTIPFTLELVEPRAHQPWLTLEATAETATVEVLFGEARCDPHALAEAKQPFKFIAQVDLGDGELHPYVVIPDAQWQTPMLQTANDACVALGKVEFVGD